MTKVRRQWATLPFVEDDNNGGFFFLKTPFFVFCFQNTNLRIILDNTGKGPKYHLMRDRYTSAIQSTQIGIQSPSRLGEKEKPVVQWQRERKRKREKKNPIFQNFFQYMRVVFLLTILVYINLKQLHSKREWYPTPTRTVTATWTPTE